MSSRRSIAFLIAGLVLAIGWLLQHDRSGGNAGSRAARQGPAQARPARGPDTPGAQILAGYASPASDAPSDLRLMHRALENFCLLVKGADPLPLGSNEEISAALRGKNKARMVFLPDGHPAFDAQGRLMDRWGTPLFFHASSRDRLDIRSAGPDHQMWTADDIHQRKDGSTFTGADLPPASGMAKQPPG